MKYKTTKAMKYKSEEVWFPLSEDILGWDIDFHTLMLNDHIRMVAYENAIKEIIKPGMTVLDIGTGTGILAKWALDAGAKRVYGVDVNKNMVPLALRRIKEAGYSNKFEIFNDFSYNVKLPEKVDVIISEILGNIVDNEDMVPILEDAKKRFLKEGGIMLPKRVGAYLVPVGSEKTYLQVKNKICKGVNKKYNLNKLLSRLGIKNQFNLYYDVIIPKSKYLSNPQLAHKEFKFDGDDKSEYQIKKTFVIKKKGLFTGFKGYFIAKLSNNVILDISGDDIKNRKTADCWKHCYLPIENPVKVKTGDRIELTYSRFYPKNRDSLFKQCYSWNGHVKRNGKGIYLFSQNMDEENESTKAH